MAWSMTGTSCTMNCACPPVRSRGITAARATCAAIAAPRSRRIKCRHRSNPAAAPADVSTFPLIDVQHVGIDARRAGNRSASSAATAPMRRRRAPVERACLREHKRSAADRGDSRASVARRAANRAQRCLLGSHGSGHRCRERSPCRLGPAPPRREGTLSVTCSDVHLRRDATDAHLVERACRLASRALPNTSHGVARSPSTTPSKATTATRCLRGRSTLWREFRAKIVFRATGEFWSRFRRIGP